MTASTSSTPGARRIAIIDDDESVRESLRGLLASVGFAVGVFVSAREFLASDYLVRADCLVVDIRMPGMSGPELQEELAVRRRPIPIVFATAYGSEELRRRVLLAGAVDCLAKPFTGEALLGAIRRALHSS